MNEKCGFGECADDPIYKDEFVVPALPDPDEGGGGGGGEGHKYTFTTTTTGWAVREDGKLIYSYTDKNDNTTYVWQATTDGWLVKDNLGNVVFTYVDKQKDTTYSFEQTDNCGIKVTDSNGVVVFEYDNNCAGTTYTFEQNGVDFKVTNDKTNQVVFTYKGTVDTNTTYTWENYKDGFKVTDSDGVVAYIYDPTLGDKSDGSYAIDTLLTTVFKGHTTISTGQIIGFTPADLVVGETLVYDGVGTVGVITADNGDGTYQVTTMTTSPGTRQGVRLGTVDTPDDLPATCAAAEALGWQTPQLGDFAYVVQHEDTAEDVISEYVITAVDDDCNLTWTFSHSFNAGSYQEQSTTSMAGMILTGGVLPGTFGTPIDPTTLIRGVMRNGVLLTPDAQGKVNVVVDDSHVIVNALPTTGIIDHIEYVVIDANQKVTGTWVHDATGWYQTYAPAPDIKAHQIVTELPTTGIEQYVEYVVIDNTNAVTGTWVYDPTKGWLQTEKPETPDHIIVKTLPTSGINDSAEYVVVDDLANPTTTFKATYVHTASGWIETSKAGSGGGHIAVTALPTTNIVEGAEYIVMTDTSDPSTLTGTWVRVNGNWVQTERVENGFHIVTALPTTNIDDKNLYIVVTDLTKPDTTFVGQSVYDKATNKWIDITAKASEVNYYLNRDGQELDSWYGSFTTGAYAHNTVVSLTQRSTKNMSMSGTNGVVLKAGKRYAISGNLALTQSSGRTNVDNYLDIRDSTNNVNIGIIFQNNTSSYYSGGSGSFQYTVPDTGDIVLQARLRLVNSGNLNISEPTSSLSIQEIGRVVDPVAYLNGSGNAEDNPVGTVITYFGRVASSSVPAHYLVCNGATYAVGTYPELEAFIIANYGSINYFGGNGTTTWAVPDLRGEFIRGAGANSHANQGAGSAVGEHQDATEHMHTIYRDNAIVGYPDNITGVNNTQERLADSNVNGNVRGVNYNINGSVYTTQTTTQRYTSRPTNTSVCFLIKYESTPFVVVNGSTNSVSVPFSINGTHGSGVPVTFTLNAAGAVDSTGMVSNNAIVAPQTGYYAISALLPESNQNLNLGFVGYYIYVNGVLKGGQRKRQGITGTSAAADDRMSLNETSLLRLTKGDKVTFQTYTPKSDGTAQTTNLSGTINCAMVSVASNTAEVMLKPNLWTPGVEQSFGDGVYGIRFVREAAMNAGTNTSVLSGVVTSSFKFLNGGGSAKRNDGMIHIAGVSNAVACPYLYTNGTAINLWSGATGSATSWSQIDVWCLYTK